MRRWWWVALLVSAWIEITGWRVLIGRMVSHSSWVRGLKYLLRCSDAPQIDVALLVSAWIEIATCDWLAWPVAGRTPRECVDWNNTNDATSTEVLSRTPRECVDWNSDERKQPFFITSHTSWVRGLKSHHKSERSWWRWSHSLWVRGLKLAYFIRQLQLFWFTWEHNLLLDYVPVCNAFVLFYYTLQNK